MSQSLRDKAIKLLARRERSRAELQRLLDPEGERGPEVAALLDELQAQGWLSEARLAEQEAMLRRTLSLLVELVETDPMPPEDPQGSGGSQDAA